MIKEVAITPGAESDLKKLPRHISRKLLAWVNLVSQFGLEYTRKHKGFHDEPLKGKRFGQRSIRLSREYRAFYRIIKKGKIEIVLVFEVNKHEY
jgi:proteic killer suppression protein